MDIAYLITCGKYIFDHEADLVDIEQKVAGFLAGFPKPPAPVAAALTAHLGCDCDPDLQEFAAAMKARLDVLTQAGIHPTVAPTLAAALPVGGLLQPGAPILSALLQLLGPIIAAWLQSLINKPAPAPAKP